MPVDRRHLLKPTALGAAFGLLAPAAHAQATPQNDAKTMFEQLAKDGKGFDMAPSSSPREPVYVVFDPQCKYCVQLWEAAKPLARQVRFVWMPVAPLNPKSEPQGAAILSSPDPATTMQAHEKRFSSGGLATGAMKIDDAARDAVWANSRIFRRARGRTVPTMVLRHRGTGAYSIVAGALEGVALKQALGLN